MGFLSSYPEDIFQDKIKAESSSAMYTQIQFQIKQYS